MDKDKPNNTNVVTGPWKKKSKVVVPEIDSGVKITEDMEFIDELAETIVVQTIHTCHENGYNIKNEEFIKDVGFLNEAVKSLLNRGLGYPHVLHGLIIKLMTAKKAEDILKDHEETFTHFDEDVLKEFLKPKKDGDKDEPNRTK